VRPRSARAVARQTEHDARDAYSGVSRYPTCRHCADAVESNATALNATESGIRSGDRTAVEVLDSRRQWIQAQTDYSRKPLRLHGQRGEAPAAGRHSLGADAHGLNRLLIRLFPGVGSRRRINGCDEFGQRSTAPRCASTNSRAARTARSRSAASEAIHAGRRQGRESATSTPASADDRPRDVLRWLMRT